MANGGSKKDTGPGAGQSPPYDPGSKPPSEPGRFARNDKNPAQLAVHNLHIDWVSASMGDLTRWRLWIPTNTGGLLTIKTDKTSKIDLRRPFNKILVHPDSEIRYEVKPGEFGEFFVLQAGAGVITPTFVQTSFSRESKSDSSHPLIPWNFWYWPTAKDNVYWDRAGEIMARFGAAFHKNPDDCRNAEHNDHVTAPVGGLLHFDWEGHCHLAAPSSILFEEPKPTSHNGQSFDEMEMKFLALEYFGNFGQMLPVWDLKPDGTQPVGKYHLPAYFKPGKPKTRDALIGAYKRVYATEHAFDDKTLTDISTEVADQLISALGGEANLETLVNKYFGELAAKFYQALIDNLRVKKQPLMANMRADGVNKGPEEVWNHALFWYQASYREHVPDESKGEAADEKLMEIRCEMRVNMDDPVRTNQLPAEVSGNDIKPLPLMSIGYIAVWQIRFDNAGNIFNSALDNGWLHVWNVSMEELYTPTELQAIDHLSKTRLTFSNPLDAGNRFVGTEVVDSGMLTIRKRFRP